MKNNSMPFDLVTLAQALLDHFDLGVLGLDVQGRVAVWNSWMAARSHVSAAAAHRRTLPEIFPGLSPGVSAALDAALTTGQPQVISPVLHPAWLPLTTPARQFVRLLPLHDADAQISGVLILVQDVTGQLAYEETAEAALRRINRALRVLSECNQALVRAADEAQLLDEICRILVEDGGFRLAWVGFVAQDEAKRVRPVAQAGIEAGCLNTLDITWADAERGRGPTGVAIRTGQPSIARNILTDPGFAPWRAEAVERGYASSIALPLISEGQTLGALNIYAAEPDAFDAEEVKLLTELAADLAYGITALRTRAERQRSVQALQESEERYRLLVENAPVGIVSHSQGKVIYANPAIVRLLGATSPQALIGRDILDFVHPDYRQIVLERARLVQVGDRSIPTLAEKFLRLDGSAVDVEVTGVPFVYQGQPAVQVTVTDITERKQAEEEIRQRAAELAALNALSQQVSRSLSLDEVIAATLDGLLEAVYPDLAFFFTRDGERLILKGVGPQSERARLGDIPEHRVGECMCGLAVSRDAAMFSRDIFADARCTWEECKRAGFRSFAALPLRSGKEIIGVIGLAANTERDFEGQAEFLETLVNQVAVSVQNARLHEAIQKHAETLERRVAERTAELQTLVKLMTGRELRMAELKDVIQQLRGQLEAAGLTPVADDRLAPWMEE